MEIQQYQRIVVAINVHKHSNPNYRNVSLKKYQSHCVSFRLPTCANAFQKSLLRYSRKVLMCNRPFYSCLLSDVAFEWQRG